MSQLHGHLRLQQCVEPAQINRCRDVRPGVEKVGVAPHYKAGQQLSAALRCRASRATLVAAIATEGQLSSPDSVSAAQKYGLPAQPCCPTTEQRWSGDESFFRDVSSLISTPASTSGRNGRHTPDNAIQQVVHQALLQGTAGRHITEQLLQQIHELLGPAAESNGADVHDRCSLHGLQPDLAGHVTCHDADNEHHTSSSHNAWSTSAGMPPSHPSHHVNAHARSPAKRLEPRQLTHNIVQTTSWHQLYTIVTDHGPLMDYIHISAALVQLARLVSSEPACMQHAKLVQLVEQLLSMVHAHMDELQARQCANIYWALGVMSQLPHAQQQAATGLIAAGTSLMPQLQQNLHSCNSQALANSLCGIAKLGLRPDASWLEVYFERSLAILDRYSPQELSTTVWAVAVIRYQPSTQWLDAFDACCRQQLDQFTQQGLVNLMWALATLQSQPSQQLMASWYVAPAWRQPEVTPQHLSNTLWALVTLQQQPHHQWVQNLLLRSHRQLHTATSQALSMTAWSLGHLAHTPEPAWSRQLLSTAIARSANSSPQAVCNLLLGLWRAGVQAPASWSRQYTSGLVQLVAAGGCTAKQLSIAVYCLGKLGASAVDEEFGRAVLGTSIDFLGSTAEYGRLLLQSRHASQPHVSGVRVRGAQVLRAQVIDRAGSSSTASSSGMSKSEPLDQEAGQPQHTEAERPTQAAWQGEPRVRRLQPNVTMRGVSRAPWQGSSGEYAASAAPPGRLKQQRQAPEARSSAGADLPHTEGAGHPPASVQLAPAAHITTTTSAVPEPSVASHDLPRSHDSCSSAPTQSVPSHPPATPEASSTLSPSSAAATAAAEQGVDAEPAEAGAPGVLVPRDGVLSPEALAQLLTGIHHLGLQPSKEWLALATQAVHLHHTNMNTIGIATSLSALAGLGADIRAQLWDHLLWCGLQRCRGNQLNSLALLVRTAAAHGVDAGQGFYGRCLEPLCKYAHRLNAVALVQLMEAVARLRLELTGEQVAAVAVAAAVQAKGMGHQQLHKLLWLSTRLDVGSHQQHQPLANTMQQDSAAAATARSSSSASTGSAAPSAGPGPEAPSGSTPGLPLCTQLLLQQLQPVLISAPVQFLVALSSSLLELGINPGSSWSRSMEIATMGKVHERCVSPEDKLQLLVSHYRCSHRPSDAWLAAWCKATVQVVHRLGLPQLSTAVQVVWEAAYVSGREELVDRQWVVAVAAALEEVAAAAAARSVAACADVAATATAASTTTSAGDQRAVQQQQQGSLVSSLDRLDAASILSHLLLVTGRLHMLGHSASPQLRNHVEVSLQAVLHQCELGGNSQLALACLVELKTLLPARSGPVAQGAAALLLHHVALQQPAKLLDWVWSSTTHTSPTAAPAGAAAAKAVLRAPALDPAQQLVDLLSSFARWGHAPPSLWLSKTLQLVTGRAQDFAAPQVAGLLRMLALSRVTPQDGFVSALLEASQGSLERCSPAQVVEMAWCLSTMQRHPSSSWWARFEAVLLPQLHHLPPASLAELLWSLAALRRRPAAEWMQCFAQAAAAQMGGFDADGLSRLIWSMAALEEAPGTPWMDIFYAHSEPQLGGFSAQNLALVMSGLATMRRKPRQGWLHHYLDQLQTRLQECRAIQVVKVLWSLASLDCKLPAPLAKELVQYAMARLHELDAGSVGELVWAVNKFDDTPDKLWYQQVAVAVSAAGAAARQQEMVAAAALHARTGAQVVTGLRSGSGGSGGSRRAGGGRMSENAPMGRVRLGGSRLRSQGRLSSTAGNGSEDGGDGDGDDAGSVGWIPTSKSLGIWRRGLVLPARRRSKK